jgi:uncharacterized protein
MARWCSAAGRAFWPDAVRLLDGKRVDAKRLLSSDQVTDSWQLALAFVPGGQLATLARRLVAEAAHGGSKGLLVIA